MFRTLIYPSSGDCDCAVELPHWSFCSWFVVCCNTDTTQTQPHQSSNTQRTKNKTTDVVIQQHSRKFLMMDILMSETCWVHKKLNKIASDIKLVFYSSAITMMHGPINIRDRLQVFKNRQPRKMFKTKKCNKKTENKQHNKELHNLCSSPNIIRIIIRADEIG